MRIKNIVYALESPVDGRVYYVGKSKHGLYRPYSHILSSHNPMIIDWLKSLQSDPVVRILERNVQTNLDDREKYWIRKMKERGEPLFNIVIPVKKHLKYADYDLRTFVKDKRRAANLTQREFATKSGVGLRFVRDLEQGKETCRIDKVLQVLGMFGATLVPADIEQSQSHTQ